MAPLLQKAVGCTWGVGSPWWALHPSCGPASPPAFTHSPSETVRWVLWACPPSPQHHTPFSGRRAVSQFNLVSLALYLAEIPQSWWHIDGTLSYVPLPKQIPPIFILPWSFLSLSEGGSLGGSWTSVLSFTIFPQSFRVNIISELTLMYREMTVPEHFILNASYIMCCPHHIWFYTFSWILFLSHANFNLVPLE